MKEKNKNLTAEQKLVLFEEGTEPPGSSELNNEKREGSYHCVNCDVKLFESKSKYESGSGWPSFFESLPNVFEKFAKSFRMFCKSSVPFAQTFEQFFSKFVKITRVWQNLEQALKFTKMKNKAR